MSLRAALNEQARACGKLGSPFMKRLLSLAAERLTDDTPIGRKMIEWPGDVGPTAASVPLRFAGGLHALCRGGYAPLAAVYPPAIPTDDALWAAVEAAMTDQSAFLHQWMQSPPQTNEVRRSATLIPAATLVSQMTGLRLALIELGASAGLNLNFDQFAVQTPAGILGNNDPVLTLAPDWHGDDPVMGSFKVCAKRGCDLAPIDAADPVQQQRLLSYLWPDQPHRVELTQAAISVAKTRVEKSDALEFLNNCLTPTDGQTRFLFHTVAWQYFPQNVQNAGAALIKKAGNEATASSPLAWFSMEAGQSTEGAELRLRVWPGDFDLRLGQADFHGRWINWVSPFQGDAILNTG